MAVNRIILNETSYFGAGARRMLADEFRGRGYVRAFVVTDKDLIRFGVAGKVTGVLDEAGVAYEIFSDLKPNPTVKNVQAGVEAFRRSGADAIVAIGGGSAMDTAKAVGIIAANPAFGDVVSLEGTAPTANRSVPVFALPTTAGTAAEVTINYVITDEANTKKMVCVDPKDIPAVAIIDAELMAAMPRGLTAATGMDALTHAIEGYITKGAWTLTDMFELKAVELIARWLPAAVEWRWPWRTAPTPRPARGWPWRSISPAWAFRMWGWDWYTAWRTRWVHFTIFPTAWPMRCCCLM